MVIVCLCGATGGAWAHGDVHERIGELSRALTVEPGRADLWLQRADLHRQHGELSQATTDVRQALRLEPDWPPALLQQARILLDRQQPAFAREAADACLDCDPGNVDARVVRARCQAALGLTHAAIRDLDRVLADVRRPLPDLYLERARHQAGLGDYRSAVQGLDEGMQRLGQTPSLAIPAFEYERRAGEIEAALARLETLQRFMSRESYLVTRGELLVQAGRGAEAVKVFREALEQLTSANSALSRSTAHQVDGLKARLFAGIREAGRSGPENH